MRKLGKTGKKNAETRKNGQIKNAEIVKALLPLTKSDILVNIYDTKGINFYEKNSNTI